MSLNHPKDDLLLKFSSGDLEDKISSVVSAHIGSCRECKSKLSQMESKMAELHFEVTSGAQESPMAFELMQEQILKKTPAPVNKVYPQINFVEVHGKSIELPGHLSHLKETMSPWRSAGSTVSHYPSARRSRRTLPHIPPRRERRRLQAIRPHSTRL